MLSLFVLMKYNSMRWLALGSFAAISISAPLRAAAQDAGPPTIRLQPEDLERGQYGPQHNFFFLPPGKTDEESYLSAGFFGQKLRPYLGNNQEALASLNAYKRQKTLYLVDRALLVGSAATYAVQALNGSGDTRYTSPSQLVTGGLLATSLVATLFINRHTNEYMRQAVDSYNGDLPTARHSSLRVLRPATYGLAASPTGRPMLALGWHL
jgi:hypothetical protein